MHERADGLVGYASEEAALSFEPGTGTYQPAVDDLYWKITLSVPNIDLACEQLQAQGVRTGTPEQFGEVGYLAHFDDPLGFRIELIDHWFQGQRPAQELDERLLGGGACLNLLTVRCHEEALIEQMAAELGLQRLAIVPVPGPGFTLHFFGNPGERPPNPDPYAIENRTWVYQRPYTVLEVVHRPQASPMAKPEANGAGYGGAQLSGLAQPVDIEQFLLSSR